MQVDESNSDIQADTEQLSAEGAEMMVQQLKNELAAANAKVAEYWEKLLRREAELQNINKQTQKRVQDAHQFAIEGFVKELLLVLDTFERALIASQGTNTSLESMQEGIALTQKQLLDSLGRFSVTVVDAEKGLPFDPQYHQALTMIETAEVPAQHIVEVIQKGYQLHGRLVRPAAVIVAKSRD